MALNLPPPVRQFLVRQHVMTIATQGAQGPWAAALFYVADEDGLVFLSAPGSRHARDLALEPRCAATIQCQQSEWRAIEGIQIEGVAGLLQGAGRDRARRRYAERFPFVQPAAAPDAIVRALARVEWYRLQIARLFFIDNSRGLGQRQQFDAER